MDLIYMDLSLLEPKKKHTLMSLVERVGMDVSDWGNFKKGPKYAASNPSYCYSWSFIDVDRRVVILNLWFDTLKSDSDGFSYELNLKEAIDNHDSKGGRRSRAKAMDEALRYCYENSVAPRVIIQDGPIKNGKREAKYRLLDEERWRVARYDYRSKSCLLERKPLVVRYIDQFSLPSSAVSETKEINTTVHKRDSKVRGAVLDRAQGICESCGRLGFTTEGGDQYLETHHIIPLSEGGPDIEENVIALCANDHRMAHYSVLKEELREQFRANVMSKLGLRGQGG